MKKDTSVNNSNEKKPKYKLSRELLYYFTIAIIIVVTFLSFMICIAIFTPKNVVVEIWYWDNNNYATYRSAVEGKELYTYIERTTVSDYVFDGYYFQNKTDEDNDGTYTFNEEYRVPDDYTFSSNVVIYARWDRVE